MKRPVETARRWLAQAEHNLGVARLLFGEGLWSEVCFKAEQAAQTALKAFLYSTGRRAVYVHAVQELASQCAKEDAGFEQFVAYGRTLDKYYLSTRYPDVLPEPAIPFQSFTEQEASQSLAFATEIVESARDKIPAESS